MADPIYCTLLIQWPCMKTEAWAAWAQAVLTVLTFAGALYWQHLDRVAVRKDQEDRDRRAAEREKDVLFRRAKAIGAIIVSDLVRLSSASQQLLEGRKRGGLDLEYLKRRFLGPESTASLDSQSIALSDLGTAAEPALALYYQLELLRGICKDREPSVPVPDDFAYERLEAISSFADKARFALRDMHLVG